MPKERDLLLTEMTEAVEVSKEVTEKEDMVEEEATKDVKVDTKTEMEVMEVASIMERGDSEEEIEEEMTIPMLKESRFPIQFSLEVLTSRPRRSNSPRNSQSAVRSLTSLSLSTGNMEETEDMPISNLPMKKE